MLQSSDILFTIFSIILNSFTVASETMENTISHFVFPSFMLDNFPSSASRIDYAPHNKFFELQDASNSGLYSSFKTCIESSKGIYTVIINSMLPFTLSRAFTINIIANDFLVITQINKVTRSMNLQDLIALLGSIDFVLGSVDLN